MNGKEYKTTAKIKNIGGKKRVITQTKIKEVGFFVKEEVSYMQPGQTLMVEIRRVR